MKDTDIRIGGFYDIKVGNHTTAVRIMRVAKDGGAGWEGITVSGDKDIVIRSASRIVGLYNSNPAPVAQGKKKPTEPAAATTAKKERTSTKPSGLDGAAKVLEEAGEPLNCQQIVKRILEQELWQTEGKTPGATIYSAILREIKAKGNVSRFRKTDKGLFERAQKE